MVQRAARNDSVELHGISEVLERHGLKDRALRRGRVDRGDPVPQVVHRSGEPAIAATDLEYPCGRGGKLGLNDVEYLHTPAVA